MVSDLNGNGIAEPAEPGISGVAVDLNQINNLGQSVLVTTVTTAPDGTFFFPLQPAGTYVIVAHPGSGARPRAPTRAPWARRPSCDANTIRIVLERRAGRHRAPALRAHAVVVDMMRPRWSMDPLRIFPADIGVDKAVDLLTPLFGCTADSPQGLTLGELLRPELGVRSIPDMLAVLRRASTPAACPTARRGCPRDGPSCTGTWTTGRASATPRR